MSVNYYNKDCLVICNSITNVLQLGVIPKKRYIIKTKCRLKERFLYYNVLVCHMMNTE